MVTNQEIVLIGSLHENQGFQLLMDALKAEEDDILDEIYAAETDEAERRLTATWRAYRRLLTQARLMTTSFKEQADAAFNDLTPMEQVVTNDYATIELGDS